MKAAQGSRPKLRLDQSERRRLREHESLGQVGMRGKHGARAKRGRRKRPAGYDRNDWQEPGSSTDWEGALQVLTSGWRSVDRHEW